MDWTNSAAFGFSVISVLVGILVVYERRMTKVETKLDHVSTVLDGISKRMEAATK